MTDTVRKQKPGDQLTVGDWLAPGEILDGAAEVLFVHAYPASADRSRDNDGTHVQLVAREQGAIDTYADVIAGNHLFNLASDEDLAPLREKAKRAQAITDLRAMADAMEQSPWLPVPHVSTLVHLHGDEGMQTVLALAERYGRPVDRHLDDRTEVLVPLEGSITLDVIAWHRGGRPAEPAPVPSGTVADEPLVTGDELVWDRDETEASLPPARFWAGYDVVRKGGMPAGFPPSLRVTRVIPIDGSGITTPQRWQFQAEGRNEWFHCDEYERVV